MHLIDGDRARSAHLERDRVTWVVKRVQQSENFRLRHDIQGHNELSDGVAHLFVRSLQPVEVYGCDSRHSSNESGDGIDISGNCPPPEDERFDRRDPTTDERVANKGAGRRVVLDIFLHHLPWFLHKKRKEAKVSFRAALSGAIWHAVVDGSIRDACLVDIRDWANVKGCTNHTQATSCSFATCSCNGTSSNI